MPGATTPNLLPYPYLAETVDSDSVKNLADAVDAKLNTSITNATATTRRPAALVLRDTGTQAFASGAAMANLTFTTEHFDNNGIASLGANNERLTIQTAGVYHVSARVLLDGGTAPEISTIILTITINGTALSGTKRRGGVTAAFSSCCGVDASCALMRRLNATDIVRAQFSWTGTTTPRNVIRAELGVRWLCSL
jgi:hypothetical protein